MRLYKVIILMNLALAIGFLAGWLWWSSEVDRLRREVAAAEAASTGRQESERHTVVGIVRGFSPETQRLYLTHAGIPGLLPATTTGFPVEDPRLPRALLPGERVQFTVQPKGSELTVVAVHKEAGS